MDDKELIRVDLLKFRRKAYLSYEEGSEERKVFLRVILKNELRLTEQEAPKEFVNVLLEGEKNALKNTLKHLLIPSAFFLYCTAVCALMWNKKFFFAIAMLICGACGLVEILLELKEFFKYKKSLKIIKQYSNDITKQMNRISNDIKKLDGPHGF